jgi:hypothetical protein
MQGLDILEQEQSILPIRNHTGCWRGEDPGSAFNLRGQRRDSRVSRSLPRLSECVASYPDPKTPRADSSNRQLVNNPERRRQAPGIERGEHLVGFVEAPDQYETSDLEIPCLRGISAIAVLFEHYARRLERLRGPPQLPRGECDFGLGHHAARACHRLLWAEATRGTPQQNLRSDEVAELRHRNAAERKRGRIIPQGDSLQRAERITGGERACRCCNQ